MDKHVVLSVQLGIALVLAQFGQWFAVLISMIVLVVYADR